MLHLCRSGGYKGATVWADAHPSVVICGWDQTHLTMSWYATFSLLFMVWCTGARSQPTLTQPPSASVSLGGTVKLSCAMSSGFNIGSYNVYWYQQKPGSAPTYLLRFYSDSSNGQGSGVPSHFSGSKDTSRNTGYLNIVGTLAEDEAGYYCAVWHSDACVFGAGTTLTVLGQPIVPPSVSVFPPSKEELKSKNKATLACLMDGFYPRVIQVEWKANDRTISAGVETSTPIKQGDKYVASSYLTLSQSEWEANENYICKVIHESKTIEKVVSRSACS